MTVQELLDGMKKIDDTTTALGVTAAKVVEMEATQLAKIEELTKLVEQGGLVTKEQLEELGARSTKIQGALEPISTQLAGIAKDPANPVPDQPSA